MLVFVLALRELDLAVVLPAANATAVRRLANARTLKTKRTRGGQRLVDGNSLAKYLVERDRLPRGIAASRQSMRNRLPGIVTRVVKDRVAAHRLVSLLTREAVDTLGLTPGMIAFATVKATNVSVELPPPAPRAKRSARP